MHIIKRTMQRRNPPEVLGVKTIKSSIPNLFLGTLALTGVLALSVSSALAQEPQTQPPQNQPQAQAPPAGQDQMKQDPAESQTFTGTIVRNGEQFSLRDSSGEVYKLDDNSKAQAFEGKQVKVTGRLDTDAKLIHIDTIESASA
jgi:uncharacterized protein YdeI (BOF family)